MSSELEEALKALLDDPPVDRFLAECKENSTSDHPVSVVLLFPRFKESEPDIQALAEFLWSQAVNYAVPLPKRLQIKAEIAAGSTGADFAPLLRLVQSTKARFMELSEKQPQRASELGEVLAYLIALRHLGAFQLASKMSLKTNGNMPVHGLDGIHARFKDGVMTLFFLESKLTKLVNQGITSFAESVKNFADNRGQYLLEYDIVADLGNLDALSPENKEAALEYLDVYGPKKDMRLERSVGAICYSDRKVFADFPKKPDTPPAIHEEAFAACYSQRYSSHRELVTNALALRQIDPSVCKVFFIAVPDVSKLRSYFYEAMNGK